MPVDPNHVKALFLEATEKVSPHERAAFLARACGNDDALHQRVLALLEAHAAGSSVLDRPAVEQFPAQTSAGLSGHAVRATEELTTAVDGPRGNLDDILALLQPPGKPGSLGRLAHYEIQEVLGEGGFGTVFKSFDEKLHRIVAIKILAPALAAAGSARQRFLREARAAAAVRDEHVIDIHAVEEQPSPFLVMEYVHGQTLQHKLDHSGPLPLKEILRIGYQVAAGLVAAHKQGLIHRDIKPSNILLENGVERVKLSDFGLARAVDDASLTQSGLVAGTPLYMSPEQAEARHIDHRSDLFSLGSVLYTLATGHAPFRGTTSLAVLKRVCEATPRPIREVNPEFPDWLDVLVARLLAKNPEERSQSAQEVADELADYLADLQVHGQVRPTRSASATAAGRDRAAFTKATPEDQTLLTVSGNRQHRGHDLRRLIGTAVIVAALALAAVLVRQFRPVPNAVPAPSDNPTKVVAPITHPLDSYGVKHLPGGTDPDPDLGPLGLVAILGDRRFQLTGARLGEMTVSPDGRLLAVPCGGQVVLFDAQTGQLVRKLAGRGRHISRLAFSSDGRQLVSAGEGGVTLWDCSTGAPVRTSVGHTAQVLSAVFAPNDKTFATGSADHTVRLWDTASGAELRALFHLDHIHGLAFSPDGQWLVTGCNDHLVRVYDAVTGDLKETLQGHTTKVTAVRFSPDGKWLATGSNELKLWDGGTFKELRTLPARSAWLGFGPEGRTVLASPEEYGPQEAFVLTRWETATGKKLPDMTLKSRGDWVSLAITPNGKTLFAARGGPPADTLVRTYDVATGQEVPRRHEGHAGNVTTAAFSPDGSLLASGGDDKTVRLWDLAGWRDGAALPPLRTLAGHAQRIASVRFSPDGTLLASGSLDRTIVLWEVATGAKVRTLKGSSSQATRLVFSPDGRTLAAGQDDGTVKFWDVATGKLTSTLTGHTGAVPTVAYSPDGKLLASGGTDKTVQVIQTDTEQLLTTLTLAGSVTDVAFAHDGQWLAAASANGKQPEFSVWQVATWEATFTGQGQRGLAFSPVARLAATRADDGSVRFWEFSDARPRTFTTRLADTTASGADLAFTPDGHCLAFTCDNGTTAIVRVPLPPPNYSPSTVPSVPSAKELANKATPADALDPAKIPADLLAQAAVNGQAPPGLVAVLGGKDGHSGQVLGVAIRPDGKFLASAGLDDAVRLWDLGIGKLVAQLKIPQTFAYCVAFSPDSRLLASGQGNGTIKIWDAAMAAEVRAWHPSSSRITSVTFSPDSARLATTSDDGSVRLWEVATGKLLRMLGKDSGPTWATAFTPDGKFLASSVSLGVISLWDLATGWEVATFNDPFPVWIRALAISADGCTLASTGYHSADPVRLWDLKKLQQCGELGGHGSPVLAACWEGAGRLLATAADTDGAVRLFDTTTNPPACKTLQVIPPGQKWLHSIAFTPEGRYLATANPGGTIYVLRLAERGAPVEVAGSEKTTLGVRVRHQIFVCNPELPTVINLPWTQWDS